MASVTAPTATTQSQPQAEFVKAMTLTDATMLVAGSMIGSGIFIVSADIARKGVAPGYLLLARRSDIRFYPRCTSRSPGA